jgi:hypothetical protein
MYSIANVRLQYMNPLLTGTSQYDLGEEEEEEEEEDINPVRFRNGYNDDNDETANELDAFYNSTSLERDPSICTGSCATPSPSPSPVHAIRNGGANIETTKEQVSVAFTNELHGNVSKSRMHTASVGVHQRMFLDENTQPPKVTSDFGCQTVQQADEILDIKAKTKKKHGMKCVVM